MEITEIGAGRLDELIDTHLSDANVAPDLVFVSGQLGLDADNNLVGEGDVVLQAEQVLKNIESVLADADATLADVVDLRLYLLDITDIPRIAPVRRRYFGDRRPAATAVEINRLVVPGALIEISAVAVRRPAS
ncbi:MAG: 3-hydroxyisobutyrate dehydrogenase and related beta-hydroxyacid dehydrogenase-like protein [Pseudonocardiales bacterium]|nr:3-hydroxyisobutyrate dehydrogenase and related beta-hydroxyacid dehydrogenase-like protein [Pseudonocardiales bacterium]